MKLIHTSLLLILSLFCFGQNNNTLKKNGLENYKWDELIAVTIQANDLAKYESDSEMLNALDLKENRINCGNIRKWKSAFSTLPYGRNKDIAFEKTYILLCEFKNGLKIPFRYFPNQYSIFDMRKEHQNYYSFPEQNNRMRSVVNMCLLKFENQN